MTDDTERGLGRVEGKLDLLIEQQKMVLENQEAIESRLHSLENFRLITTGVGLFLLLILSLDHDLLSRAFAILT